MTSVRGFGLLTSGAAPVLMIGGWTLAARLQPGHFDAVTGTISALAARGAHQPWVMTAALAGTGLCHLGTALALRPAARPGRIALAVGGLATIGVAAFPLPVEDTSPPHAITAGLAFISLAVWPALAAVRPRRPTEAPSDAGARRPETAVATPGTNPPAGVTRNAAAGVTAGVTAGVAVSLVLGAGVAWFFAELLGGGDQVGLSERVAAGAQSLAPLAAVLAARPWRT